MEGRVLGDFGVDCRLDVAGHSIILILLPGQAEAYWKEEAKRRGKRGKKNGRGWLVLLGETVKLV